MKEIHLLFGRFEENLRMSPSTVESVRQRYRLITSRLNRDFWGSGSDREHSRYAGSYGRGTAISTSDIDILVELPKALYSRYRWQTYQGHNGPSRLLQSVKTSLQQSYPKTELRGDGQVVVVAFSDGVRFEVVPVFSDDCRTLIYPDTHNGGSWPKMKPEVESRAFADLSRRKPGGLNKFCRMLRASTLKRSLNLPGQAIDAMAYEYWQQADYSNETPFLYFDRHSRDFFTYWVDRFRRKRLIEAPGSHREIEVSLCESELELLEQCAEISRLACVLTNTPGSVTGWRAIYGDEFPAS